MVAPLLLQRFINKLGHPLGINPYPRAFENPIAENCSDAKGVFDQIFRDNFWASSESRSGVGSETCFAYRYSQRLKDCLLHQNLRTIFDAPCGDLNWMAGLATNDLIYYIGGDISTHVIQAAQTSYPDIDLRVFDICQDPFPQADVWHCRDCLFHLPFQAIHQALANFSRSTIPYALITSHHAKWLHKNLDVNFGGFRLLDLCQPPISLPLPLLSIVDYRRGRDFPRYVCLWSREQIAKSISQVVPLGTNSNMHI